MRFHAEEMKWQTEIPGTPARSSIGHEADAGTAYVCSKG
jgi:hypothetical protein